MIVIFPFKNDFSFAGNKFLNIYKDFTINLQLQKV